MTDRTTATSPAAPPTDHVEETVQRMAEMHADYVNQATPTQRRVASITKTLAKPGLLIVVFGLVAVWVLYNSVAGPLGLPVPDAPPFPLLEAAATVFALFTTLLILATQRREEEFARRRAQLTLQLAAISEQKIAKVISILEEQRRENPMLPTRVDPEADDMARAADPRQVLDRIIETHENQPAEADKPDAADT